MAFLPLISILLSSALGSVVKSSNSDYLKYFQNKFLQHSDLIDLKYNQDVGFHTVVRDRTIAPREFLIGIPLKYAVTACKEQYLFNFLYRGRF